MKFKSLTLAFILLAGCGLEAWGQTNSNGMFGARSTGSSITPGMSSFGGTSSMGGMSGMGMGGMSGMSGMSGMGMSGMGGSSGMGMGGMGGSSGMGMGGMSGMNNSSAQAGQFIGANTGGTFIGGGQLQNQGNRSNMQQNYGMNAGQSGQFGNMRGGNQANRANQQMYGQGGSQYGSNQTQLRITRVADFEYPKSPGTEISSTLSRQLQQTVGKRSSSSIEASYQGNTLVLKGTVATVHDRDLAGLMARMEPGVDQVQNDLVVKKADSADSKK